MIIKSFRPDIVRQIRILARKPADKSAHGLIRRQTEHFSESTHEISFSEGQREPGNIAEIRHHYDLLSVDHGSWSAKQPSRTLALCIILDGCL